MLHTDAGAQPSGDQVFVRIYQALALPGKRFGLRARTNPGQGPDARAHPGAMA